MRKNYILLFTLLIGVILLFKSRILNTFFAEQGIKTAKNIGHARIEADKSVYFGHKEIDNFYDANGYKYFYFIQNKKDKIPVLDSKTLKIYSDKNFTIDEIAENSILVPNFLFEFVTINESDILYPIISVDKKHTHSYLYEIQKSKL